MLDTHGCQALINQPSLRTRIKSQYDVFRELCFTFILRVALRVRLGPETAVGVNSIQTLA